MRTSEWARRHYEKLANDPEYLAALAMTRVNEQIAERMVTLGISQRELARRLGKAQSFVSRLLNHGTNVTMVTLESIAVALDADLEAPRLIPKEPAVRWAPAPQYASPTVSIVTISDTVAVCQQPADPAIRKRKEENNAKLQVAA